MEDVVFYLLDNGTVAAVPVPVISSLEDDQILYTEAVYMLDEKHVVYAYIADHMLINKITAEDAEQRQPEIFDRLMQQRIAQSKHRLIDFFLLEEKKYDTEACNYTEYSEDFDRVTAYSVAAHIISKALMHSDDPAKYLEYYVASIKHRSKYDDYKKQYMSDAIKNIQEKLK